MLKRNDIELYKKKELSSQKTLLVKKMDFTFNDQESQIISITDLSAYIKLKKEEDTVHFLSALNASVHHEMITPIKTTIDIAKRLLKKFLKIPQERKMIETILLASQFILLHAHDFLDKQIIEHGSFIALNQRCRIDVAVAEMVQIMNYTL